MDIRIHIYIWIYQICRSNLHIVGYTSIISTLGCLNLPYLHYGELPMFWQLNRFNLLFLADIKDDWFLPLWSLLESPCFATCAGWARPPKLPKPGCTGCATSRCQRTAERRFGCGAAAVAGGNILWRVVEPRKWWGYQRFFTKDTCNWSDLPKNVVIWSGSQDEKHKSDLGDFTEYGDFTKLQGIMGIMGTRFCFPCCIQLLGQRSFDPCPLSSKKWSQFLESNYVFWGIPLRICLYTYMRESAA